MTAAFDPYHRWLGIAPQEQPPHHYRLLGLHLWEADPDVIESAADRQMSHVRSFQSGKHAAYSQHLLNELATSKLALLDPQKKAAYDEQLRAKLAKRKRKPRPAKATAKAAAPPPSRLTAGGHAGPSRVTAGGHAGPGSAAAKSQPLQPIIDPRGNGHSRFRRQPKGPHPLALAALVDGPAVLLVAAVIAVATRPWERAAPTAGVLEVGAGAGSGSSRSASTPPLPRVPLGDAEPPKEIPAPSDGGEPQDVNPNPMLSADGLLAHWRLDEGQGGLARDAVGGHHAAIDGATWTEGLQGAALRFDGIGNRVAIGNPAELNVEGEITLAAWVRLASLPQPVRGQARFTNIVAHGFSADPFHEVSLRADSSQQGEVFYSTGQFATGRRARGALPPDDVGKWVHLSGVYDGVAWRIYRNGQQIGEKRFCEGAEKIPADWSIGGHHTVGNRCFHGDIADVRIYGRALSPTEIRAIWQRRGER